MGLDLRSALALLREGRDLRDAAGILKVDRSTLRRRLREHGVWPVSGHLPLAEVVAPATAPS